MKLKILITVLLSIVLVGCLDIEPDTVKSDQKIHYEIGQLPELMSMPVTPLKTKWQVCGARSLCALLTYSQNDYHFILSNSTSHTKNINANLTADIYRDWVEPDIKLNVKYHKINDYYELIGIHRIEANLFTQAYGSPFVTGGAIPLGNGLILVLLSAM